MPVNENSNCEACHKYHGSVNELIHCLENEIKSLRTNITNLTIELLPLREFKGRFDKNLEQYQSFPVTKDGSFAYHMNPNGKRK